MALAHERLRTAAKQLVDSIGPEVSVLAWARRAGVARRLAVSPAHGWSAPGPSGMLTPREREVAVLVERGLTNRQIADALVIADGTAGVHVDHILNKLGFGSRAQVAAWAVENGLPATAQSWLRRSGRVFITSVALFAALVVALLGTQWLAYTPPIRDAHGNAVPGRVASLERVRLGEAEQWISVRGWDMENPVLLVIPGSPCGSYMGEGSRVWGELEKHFTIVEWDPRGVAKSYAALQPTSRITLDQNVADVIELSNLLRARFDQDKIYLVGHSGGSIYGVHAVQQRPDLYAAYIGGTQMVNNRLSDQTIYSKLLERAIATGDRDLERPLMALGPPPYAEPEVMLSDFTNVTRVGQGLAMQYSLVINGGAPRSSRRASSAACSTSANPDALRVG